MPPEFLADFRRYAELIGAAIPPGVWFTAEEESATAVQVERGIVYPSALVALQGPWPASAVDRLIDLATSERLATIAIVDRSGHHRPVYRALLVYCWLQAFRILYERLPQAEFGRWDEALRAWCDLIESELGQIDWPASGPMPAGRGASATESAWMGLALHVAGKLFVRDAWTDLASATFGQLTRVQSPSGAFLAATASDNPETHWYHELVLLHAAASYAVQAEDRHLASAVAASAEFHLRETQPDHATTQPWGLFAFIWNPRTRSLADQLLHAAAVQGPGRLDGVSLLLLSDALYCLRLFTGQLSAT